MLVAIHSFVSSPAGVCTVMRVTPDPKVRCELSVLRLKLAWGLDLPTSRNDSLPLPIWPNMFEASGGAGGRGSGKVLSGVCVLRACQQPASRDQQFEFI
jgi:hypothetical protein